MNLQVNFTEIEMLDFLICRGYTAQIEEVEYSIPIYHNSTEEHVANMWVIRDHNGKIIHRTSTHKKNDWLENAFQFEISKKLKNIILN